MEDFRWHNPVRSHFGCGCLERLPELVGDRRVLLVTFRSAHDSGLIARVKGLLGRRLVEIIDTVATRPELGDVAAAHRRLWHASRRPDVIVALGGGSVIDFAKAISCLPESGHFLDLLTHATPLVRRLRVIAVPTISGSGSEVTPYAVIWDTRDRNQAKYTLQHARMWPEAALVDPELTLSLPKVVMRNAALDALAHALEAIWNVNASPLTDLMAVDAARTVLARLPVLWRFQGNLRAREEIARAAWQAGLCLSQTRTALAHALSYSVTLARNTPHGLAAAWSLPWVWRQANGVDAARDAVLAQVFGVGGEDAITRLEAFLHALEVPTDPAAWGLDDEALGRLAQEYFANPNGHAFLASSLRQP